ncbi:MAG: hypothetical protein R3A80_02125 [Bdellovibrionota bacterium]
MRRGTSLFILFFLFFTTLHLEAGRHGADSAVSNRALVYLDVAKEIIADMNAGKIKSLDDYTAYNQTRKSKGLSSIEETLWGLGEVEKADFLIARAYLSSLKPGLVIKETLTNDKAKSQIKEAFSLAEKALELDPNNAMALEYMKKAIVKLEEKLKKKELSMFEEKAVRWKIGSLKRSYASLN